jgi:hypothetical protein
MKAANLPSHENEMVPPASAGKLAIYTDSMGMMKLLGPSGWGCSAVISVDGSCGLTITPTNSGIWTNSDHALRAGSTVEEINGSQTGAATSRRRSSAGRKNQSRWIESWRGWHNAGFLAEKKERSCRASLSARRARSTGSKLVKSIVSFVGTCSTYL